MKSLVLAAMILAACSTTTSIVAARPADGGSPTVRIGKNQSTEPVPAVESPAVRRDRLKTSMQAIQKSIEAEGKKVSKTKLYFSDRNATRFGVDGALMCFTFTEAAPYTDCLFFYYENGDWKFLADRFTSKE